MEATSMMLAFSSRPQPIINSEYGMSETLASVVRLDDYRCSLHGPSFDSLDIFARVREFEADWDGHGANPPRKGALKRARRFWTSLNSHHNLPLPDVMATPEGGVYLEWDTPNAVLMIEFGPRDEIDIYARTADFDVDGQLTDYRREFLQTLRAL